MSELQMKDLDELLQPFKHQPYPDEPAQLQGSPDDLLAQLNQYVSNRVVEKLELLKEYSEVLDDEVTQVVNIEHIDEIIATLEATK